MQRRRFAASLAFVFVVPLLAACSPQSDPEAAQHIRLYQVLPVARTSPFNNAAGEGEAIALINAGTKPYTVTGWTLNTSSGTLSLPKLTMEAGQVVHIAHDAEYFKLYWNFDPQFEFGADTDKAVPDLKVPDQKVPVLNDAGDVVRLLDEKGSLVDILAYGAAGEAPAPWSGPAVQLVDSFPLTPGNQVLTRTREDGVLELEPKATSWSGGTREAAERVYFAGQSDFPVAAVSGPMTLTAASAPDNSGPLLMSLIDKAEDSIKLVGYQFNNKEIAERLVAAEKRGVKVQVGMERNPSGKDLYDSDKEAQAILHEGGVEILYYHKWDGDLSSRFNPIHSKYAIFDEKAVLVSTGNWTGSVWPEDPSCGNREWMALIEGSEDVVKLVREVWDFDFASGHPEVRRYEEKLDRPLQPDTYDAGPCLPYNPVKPQPLTVSGNATITRILSPDNTMDRTSGFLGQIRGAKQELVISAAYINKWWGRASEEANFTAYPQPYLQEIVAAARRGVDVKVLLDSRHAVAGSPRDNQYVVQYLNDLAKQESLKLEARMVNMDGAGIGRTYHNKSLIVDGGVIISSINGSENSFRYARELALRIDGVPEFTQYYRDLFGHDWAASARPNMPPNVVALPRNTGTFVNWSPSIELDVVSYEVYYKSNAAAAWQKLGEVKRPGYDDGHFKGIWGVVAVTRAGARSGYAEISR